MRRFTAFCALLAALAVSCGNPAEPEPEPLARLRSLNVSTNGLVLPEGGSGKLTFTVKDPDFVFNYDLTSATCQLRLLDSSGAVPEEFRLSSVRRGGGEGVYDIALTDARSGKVYEVRTCLAIVQRNARTGQESVTLSEYFTVRSEAADPTGGVNVRTGLPVVYVDTQNGVGVTSKTEYVPASLYIKGAGGQDGLEAVNCSIRGRGNSTWEWPKKPYLLKMDQKTSVLGMPKHKRWILLANFMDRTLMRNLVSMKVASLTSLDWTPGCRPVELVLNGRHLGSYLLIEQVRVDKKRVDITEMTPEDNSGDALTGGYLLELDFHFDNVVQWQDHNIPFAVKYPDEDEITSAQKNYIKNYIAEVSNAIYGSDFADSGKGYAKYLDVDSFIDYWLVFEVMCNHELGNPGSVYMHKDRGGKLVAGPCWDFDWGVLSFYTSRGDTRLVNDKAIWYSRLFQDPAFRDRVRARFKELLPLFETIPDYMDSCESLLTESARINFSMWNPADDRYMNNGSIINGDEYLSFHDAVSRLKQNYRTHLRIIGEKL